jgi:hypothetical protein
VNFFGAWLGRWLSWGDEGEGPLVLLDAALPADDAAPDGALQLVAAETQFSGGSRARYIRPVKIQPPRPQWLLDVALAADDEGDEGALQPRAVDLFDAALAADDAAPDGALVRRVSRRQAEAQVWLLAA